MFPPIFALNRVSPAVETALGKAMLARAKLERQAFTAQPMTDVVTEAYAKTILRLVELGENQSPKIAPILNISTQTASSRLRKLKAAGLLREIPPQVGASRKPVITYATTPAGRERLAE